MAASTEAILEELGLIGALSTAGAESRGCARTEMRMGERPDTRIPGAGLSRCLQPIRWGLSWG